jgi:streptomycin 6-kinase
VIDVPQVVRNKARNVGATSWVDELPSLVDDLERAWGMTVGTSYEEGTEAFVAQVTLDDGTPAVLKLLIPRGDDDRSVSDEATVLRLANGDGCARLLRDDVERSALLLERLGPSMFRLGLPIEQRHELLTATAARLWRPAPDCGLRTGAEKGRWLADEIVRMFGLLDEPCAERTIEHALACAESRIAAHDDERAVLVHGDVHQWNTLQAGESWKLIDPDGLLADAEYDLGIIMREDPLDGDLRERAAGLAARTGLDETAIWEWGVVERVSTGLLCVLDDLQPVGADMLAAADKISSY